MMALNYTYAYAYPYEYYEYPDYSTNDSGVESDGGPERSLLENMGIGAGVAMVFVCIIGIVGNVMSIVIFVGPDFRRTSINTLLTALSTVDLCLLIVGFPTFVFPPISKLVERTPLISELNVLTMIYCYPLSTMFQSASVWLLILVTLERWCAVKHPLYVKIFFTRRRAVYMIVTTLLVATAYNVVRFWEFRRAPPPVYIDFNLRSNKAFMLYYVNVAGTLTTYIIPLSLLCVLNIQMVHAIVKARSSRQRMSASEIRDFKMTKSMGAVVLVFVLCDSFAFALNIVEFIDRSLFHTDWGFFLSDTNNLLVIFNSASTWMFYLMYSSRYRLQAKKFWFGFVCREVHDEEISIFHRQTVRAQLLMPVRRWKEMNGCEEYHSEVMCSPIPGVGARRGALIGDSHKNYQKISSAICLTMDDRKSSRQRSKSNETELRARKGEKTMSNGEPDCTEIFV